MSDTTRQSASDKIGAAVKPDSEKGVIEQGMDHAKGAMDSMASTAQPESQKSMGQKATDAVSGNSNKSTGTNTDQSSISQKAKDAIDTVTGGTSTGDNKNESMVDKLMNKLGGK